MISNAMENRALPVMGMACRCGTGCMVRSLPRNPGGAGKAAMARSIISRNRSLPKLEVCGSCCRSREAGEPDRYVTTGRGTTAGTALEREADERNRVAPEMDFETG